MAKLAFVRRCGNKRNPRDSMKLMWNAFHQSRSVCQSSSCGLEVIRMSHARWKKTYIITKIHRKRKQRTKDPSLATITFSICFSDHTVFLQHTTRNIKFVVCSQHREHKRHTSSFSSINFLAYPKPITKKPHHHHRIRRKQTPHNYIISYALSFS